MTSETTKIVILGGGYAGIMAALRIAGKTKRQNTAVTLISALDHFVERPRLHEQATGTSMKGKPITDMLRGSKAQFVPGWVTRIAPDQKLVQIDTDRGECSISYDYVVNALGSRVDRHTVPGVREHAFTLDPYGKMTTRALGDRLAELGARPFKAIIVGGGATGVEMAGQLKGQYPLAQVTLVTQGEAGAFKGPRVQTHIMEALAEQHIDVCENLKVVEVTADGVLTRGSFLDAELVIWAGGFVASPLAREAGIRVNGRSQVLVDPYLRSLSHPEIFAAGDMAAPVEEPGAPMRMALFTALVSGGQAADNIVATIQGKGLWPLSFAWYGQGIAIGPKDAVGFSTYPVDRPIGPILRRAMAVKVRRFFVWFLKAALELERRFPGVLLWNGRKRFEKQHRQKQERQAETAFLQS
jgi:NADH dehydrogenase